MRKKSLSKYLKIIVVTVAMSSLVLVGCGTDKSEEDTSKTPNNEVVQEQEEKPQEEVATDGSLPIATIAIEGMGTIKAELYPSIAPNTVNNFIELANEGFYDGLIFHRVIKNFMIQGGDPEGTGMGGPGYSIKGEFSKNKFENNLSHTPGVLSMARSQSADSAGSQFFIMTENAKHLDSEYAAFGKVIEGMNIVDQIEAVKTGSGDKPKEDVKIESIKVDTNGKTYPSPEKIGA